MEKGSSSASNASADSLNGLKFGKKIYFEDLGGGSSSRPIPAAGTKWKGVAQVAGGPQKPPRCQVEGCNLDMTGLKAYYCRHKVCASHSKSPRVIVAGLEQRFCQQCSRFHLLSEFDQVKRSCRRRLAGHNERRRKPPHRPLTSRYSRLLSDNDDNSRYRSFLMDFAYTRPPGSLICDSQWHGNFDARAGFVTTNPSPSLFAAPKLALDSSCALSLLSNQPWTAIGTISAPPGNHEIALITPGERMDGGPMAHLNMTGSYMNGPWGFKEVGPGSDPVEMGLGSSHFSGELELALQGDRQIPDELGQHEGYGTEHSSMRWSL